MAHGFLCLSRSEVQAQHDSWSSKGLHCQPRQTRDRLRGEASIRKEAKNKLHRVQLVHNPESKRLLPRADWRLSSGRRFASDRESVQRIEFSRNLVPNPDPARARKQAPLPEVSHPLDILADATTSREFPRYSTSLCRGHTRSARDLQGGRVPLEPISPPPLVQLIRGHVPEIRASRAREIWRAAHQIRFHRVEFKNLVKIFLV